MCLIEARDLQYMIECSGGEHSKFVEKVLKKRESEPCRPEVLLGERTPYLQEAASNRSFPLEALTPKQAKDLVVACDDRVPGPSLIQQFNKLELQLHRKEAEAALLLRDHRKPVSRDDTSMPDTVRALEQFEKYGGKYLEMKFDWMADFYALNRVREAVQEGNLTFEGEDGAASPLTLEHVDRFTREVFESGLLDQIDGVFQPEQGSGGESPESVEA